MDHHETAEYMGDGVYAYFDGYQVWIYTHDGMMTKARIALPNDGTWERLTRYTKRHYGE